MSPTVLISVGDRFERWAVIGRAPSKGRRNSVWRVRCDCGTERDVVSTVLRRGESKSCGCLRIEVSARRETKHGHAIGTTTRTYNSWASAVQRCTNPLFHNFNDYGGRGIRICDRWRTFENFLADMGERPEGHTLDRFPDNNGNYEPGNCRWATPKQQAANRRVRKDSLSLRKCVEHSEVKA